MKIDNRFLGIVHLKDVSVSGERNDSNTRNYLSCFIDNFF